MHDADLERSQFVERLTAAQQPLFAYISTMLGGSSHVQDVLQDTNLDLWAKADEYDPDQPFLRWAYRFAYYRILVHRKAQVTTKLVFTEEVLSAVDKRFRDQDEAQNERLQALGECLERLSTQQRKLLRMKYEERMSLKSMGRQLNTTEDQLASRFYRIRQGLLRCIRFRIGEAMG